MMNKLVTGLLLSVFYCTSAQADFSGAYVVANWDLGQASGTINNDGSVDLSGAPTSISLVSNNTGINDGNQDFTITAIEDATISFDWSFSTADTDGNVWDPFGYLVNGTFFQVSDDTDTVFSGTTTFSVSMGEVFGFRATTVDGIFGSSTTVVSGFTATPTVVPLPPSVSLLSCAFGGLVLVQRRRKQTA